MPRGHWTTQVDLFFVCTSFVSAQPGVKSKPVYLNNWPFENPGVGKWTYLIPKSPCSLVWDHDRAEPQIPKRPSFCANFLWMFRKSIDDTWAEYTGLCLRQARHWFCSLFFFGLWNWSVIRCYFFTSLGADKFKLFA